MQIIGRYSLKSPAVHQLDHQIEPQHWSTVDGYKFPVRGPFTQAVADRGTAVLYVSQPGEVPLYYSLTPGWIHWHEHALALPGKAIAIKPGTAVIWSPQSCKTVSVESLSAPDIQPALPLAAAIDMYKSLLLAAIERRLPKNSSSPIAVAQSGGADSTLVAWGLKQLGRDFVPLTACVNLESHDVERSAHILAALGCAKPIPVLVSMHELNNLRIAAQLYGSIGRTTKHLQQAMSHLMISRKCQELGITTLFCGHGQDDIHGRLAEFGHEARRKIKTSTTPSQTWRDCRLEALSTQPLIYEIIKLYASVFRHFGIAVRMPYFDADFYQWVLAQPTAIVPVSSSKPLVMKVLEDVLPNYAQFFSSSYLSTGFTKGAGFPEVNFSDSPFYTELIQDFDK